MKKILLMVALIGATSFTFAEEVSVFEAGNIASDNPYGLTENEQVLLANKKRVDNIQATLKTHEEDIVGLRSVLEGSNSQISKLESRVSDLEIRTTGKVSKLADKSASTVTSEDIAGLKKDIQELKAQIAVINQKLGTQGVKKNENLVQKSDEKVVQAKKTTTKTQEKSSQTQTKKPVKKVVAFDDMKKEDIMQDAQDLFNKKEFSKAKVNYDYLASKNYKPAFTNFMLGEISYNQKSYSSAITSYQKSIKHKDDATYMPTLLSHTAISLEKIGDKSSADKFYSVLKSKYPNSAEAKAIKK
ncbi:tetratricopeptide repeat protein [Campylobacter geochelonis]|uniref:tetratricopeptide repeat protein n=1 Tax=Campylobacter geochelonis TaxID=1780362 RepID=UPI00077092FF|nr:hypothetical protein [Campylobacter geochelonis]CZE50249.1 TPR repeat-containing protein [Campylobacter geochelonis]